MMISLILAGMALMAAPVFAPMGPRWRNGFWRQGDSGGYDPGTTGTFVQNNAFTTAPEFSPGSYQDSTAFDNFSPNSAANTSFTEPSFNDATPVSPSSSSNYTSSSSNYGSSSSSNNYSSYSSSSYSGGGYYGYPVLLDLDGNGLDIIPLSSSNIFYDMAGDGYQHRSAWAGAGDGVLVLDTDGNGQITQRNQVVFTDWDPTAKDDMQALRDVFDTNHNGMLDAAAVTWSRYKGIQLRECVCIGVGR